MPETVITHIIHGAVRVFQFGEEGERMSVSVIENATSMAADDMYGWLEPHPFRQFLSIVLASVPENIRLRQVIVPVARIVE
jgi:hypothetical protein